MKALSRDVDQRYATAQEFGDELEKAARALNSVGSVRDVAECLQEVIGADLSQQRDAVRAWLARSEPSDSTGPRTGPRSRPMLDSIVTRVDGGSKSEPSSSRREGSSASRAFHGGSLPPLITSERLSTAPEKVSSVSSAVILVPPSGYAPGPAGAAAPSRGRTGARIALVLLAAVVLMGVGAWGMSRLGSRSAARGGGPVAPLSSTSVPMQSASALASSPGAEPSRAPTAVASVAAPQATPSVQPVATAVARPGMRPTTRPAASGKPATTKPGGGGVPDELNNNPYR